MRPPRYCTSIAEYRVGFNLESPATHSGQSPGSAGTDRVSQVDHWACEEILDLVGEDVAPPSRL